MSEEVSWEDAWRAGRTAWDAGSSSPALVDLVATGELDRLLEGASHDRPARVLVPGAGSGYDLLTLAARDRVVTGVDLAPSAATRFAELRATTSPATSPQYLTRDFFELAAEDDHLGAYDLIWDYTFFCALPPGVRDAWASSMERLLKPRGVLVTLMFPLVEGPDVDRDQGPPYPLTRAIYERHLLSTGRRFTLEHVSDSIRSHPGREGRERVAIWRRT